MDKKQLKGLRQLARLHGVQTEYRDVTGRLRPAAPEALLGVLASLGAPVDGEAGVADALRQRRHEVRTRRVEPVAVAWSGRPAAVTLRLPESELSARLTCHLTTEAGRERAWDVPVADLVTLERFASEGRAFVVRRLPLPDGLPAGYHRLRIEGAGAAAEVLVIAASERAYTGADGARERLWGLFCPPYALHRRSSWGAGDFADLEALMGWVQSRRGDLIATLPMLASFVDDAPSVSPYSPASRLFWNEFYLDLDRIPELALCAPARALMQSEGFRAEVEALRREPLIHYGRQMRLKRRVLELLADAFFAQESGRSAEFRRFVAAAPEVEDYARFMAAGERHGRRWMDWPEALRDHGGAGEVDEQLRRYHLYAQWQADEQLRTLAEVARAQGLTWYVDFPIGVDLSSFDVWRHREIFALGASVGCPPDSVFTKGQDWGFPPPHPQWQREQHYQYLIAAVKNHFRYADALRIDHVMGLHRLYWIPGGLDATAGAFVTYPEEEILAILSVESHRRRAWLVGENLGTVPVQIERAMKRHAVHGMYVVQYELRPGRRPLPEPPHAVVASVNTHDMPPFAAHWQGLDIADRLDLGLLDAAGAAAEGRNREALRQSVVAYLRGLGLLRPEEDDPAAVLRACWAVLAGSEAHVVLLNVEDFWLETEPQNTPNTCAERPNWRRKLRHGLEAFDGLPGLGAALDAVADLRAGSHRIDAGAPEIGVILNRVESLP
ncbi:MAG TPA: 4-alpha-glucanotransferase [Isosphaeraceae bacterium]